MGRPLAIVPSVLPADFARLGEECIALAKAGADRIQWDVMDGRFVPNLTFGPDIIAACRSQVTLPFEAHLMIETPEAMVPRFVEAGCEIVIIHAEATRHLHRALTAVAEAGATPAVALNPSTPANAVAHVLDLVEMVLVMTVNPGFGGQRYISTMEPKIAEVRRLADQRRLDLDVEVDGGIAPHTVGRVVSAGANVLVAGSALYKDSLGLDHAVEELRACAEAARQETPS